VGRWSKARSAETCRCRHRRECAVEIFRRSWKGRAGRRRRYRPTIAIPIMWPILDDNVAAGRARAAVPGEIIPAGPQELYTVAFAAVALIRIMVQS
jgi:hypothetical protein